MILNTFNSVTQPATTGYIAIDQWLSKIRSSEFSSTILDARDGILDYYTTKTSIPAVTYNFIYEGYKKDANCIKSTNCVFIDIDNPAFDISKLDKTKIYACYKSFGGVGYCIIAKTKGVTYDNFKASYQLIVNDLNISSYIDFNAIKQSQFSVLSYDPNLFVNPDAYVFDFSLSIEELNKSIHEYRNQKSTHSYVIGERERIYDRRGALLKSDIVYDNIGTIDVKGNIWLTGKG